MALGVGLFFELFWLDLIPAGTYIPPHGPMSVFICLAVSRMLGWQTAPAMFPVIILSLPFAWLGRRLEYWQRGLQNRSFNRLLQWSRNEDEGFRPAQLVGWSLVQIALMQAGLFLAATLCLTLALDRFPEVGSLLPRSLKWSHLWFLASIGGILSLRVRRAYGLFGAGVAGLGIVYWLTGS